MIFSKIPALDFAGFGPLEVMPEPATPDVALVLRHPLAPAQAAVAAVAMVKPVYFTGPESAPSDSMFKQGRRAAAGYIGDVMHHVIQPKPQSGNKYGKRL